MCKQNVGNRLQAKRQNRRRPRPHFDHCHRHDRHVRRRLGFRIGSGGTGFYSH